MVVVAIVMTFVVVRMQGPVVSAVANVLAMNPVVAAVRPQVVSVFANLFMLIVTVETVVMMVGRLLIKLSTFVNMLANFLHIRASVGPSILLIETPRPPNVPLTCRPSPLAALVTAEHVPLAVFVSACTDLSISPHPLVFVPNRDSVLTLVLAEPYRVPNVASLLLIVLFSTVTILLREQFRLTSRVKAPLAEPSRILEMLSLALLSLPSTDPRQALDLVAVTLPVARIVQVESRPLTRMPHVDVRGTIPLMSRVSRLMSAPLRPRAATRQLESRAVLDVVRLQVPTVAARMLIVAAVDAKLLMVSPAVAFVKVVVLVAPTSVETVRQAVLVTLSVVLLALPEQSCILPETSSKDPRSALVTAVITVAEALNRVVVLE